MEPEFVCSSCLVDTPFQTFVNQYGVLEKCKYCGLKRPKIKVVPFEDLISHIDEEVRGTFEEDSGEYRDDEDEPVARILDSFDLLETIGFRPKNQDLYDDVRGHFSHSDWISYDPYEPTENEVNSGGWSLFKHAVKHSHRYTFLQHYTPGRHEDDPEHIHMAHVPGMLLGTVSNNVFKLDSGTKMWRIRVLDSDKAPQVPHDFTSPPLKYAIQPNRMSPSGIPMFYGAEEIETSVAETVDLLRLDNKRVFAHQFETTHDFYILDLTPVYGRLHHEFHQKVKTKSYYEDEFLYEFARDLAQPVPRDGRHDIEYVPTQVFTEFVRYALKSQSEQPVYGIRYTSSKNGGGCYVLFAEQGQCLDDDQMREGPQLLRPVPDSLIEWKHENRGPE